jgi:hypothetical protein
LNDLRVHFPDDVASQIVGVTPYWTHDEIANFSGWSEIGGDASKEKHRQREILLWMKDHAPKGKWLAIDDRPEYFHEDCEGLFIVPNNGTNGYCGLTTKVSYDFFEKLKAFLH